MLMCVTSFVQVVQKVKSIPASKTGKKPHLLWKQTGFKAAETQHGMRYINFIGDGDSSVYPTLVTGVPG